MTEEDINRIELVLVASGAKLPTGRQVNFKRAGVRFVYNLWGKPYSAQLYATWGDTFKSGEEYVLHILGGEFSSSTYEGAMDLIRYMLERREEFLRGGGPSYEV